MNKKTKKIILSLTLFLALAFWASTVFALEITYPKLPGGISLPQEPKLQEYVRYIYAFSIFIAGFIALGSLIYGGFRYLISAGNPVAMMAARDWIGAGFSGVLILLASYLILYTINPQLVGLGEIEFKPEEVPEFVVSPPPIPPTQKDLAFQIPIGKIIEETILSGRTESDLRELNNTTQEIFDRTRRLDSQLFELKALIDSCNCGISQCTAGCQSQSCRLNCDIDDIRRKASEIKNSPILSELEQKEGKIAQLRSRISQRLLNLFKAVFLTTIFYDEVKDYFTFVIERDEVSRIQNREVVIETLPEWEDIDIKIRTPDGRVIADPTTFYFWKTFKEMDDAISFASNAIGSYSGISCLGTGVPVDTVCTPSNPGAFVWPAQGSITLRYGDIRPPYSPTNPHAGIDIANIPGTPIFAAAAGKVISTHTGCPAVTGLSDPNTSCGSSPGGRLGNHIVIEHENFDPNVGTIYTTYAHLQDVFVNIGDTVSRGQQIGTMDTTGYADGSHLHFTVGTIPYGHNIDPETYLSGAGSTVCGPGGTGGGGRCEVITDPENPCAVSNLQPYFGVHAAEASQICNAESGGDPWSLNDGCLVGNYDYSVGLFQINLYRTGRCPGAFREITAATCEIIDRDRLRQCEQEYGLGNPQVNSQKAAEIFGGVSWCPWSTAFPQYCNLCPNPP